MKIRTENLSKSYNNRLILKDINLNFNEKKIYTIIGPNGSGKTTLLKLLNGLDKPTKGIIFWDNLNFWEHSYNVRLNYIRKMSLVFQNPVVFKDSVFENIAYGLRCRKKDKNYIHQKVLEILKLVELENLKEQNAKTLSGGELQRLSIGRALSLEPELLFLDEPTANLDPYNVEMIENLINSLKKSITIILTTHNLFQVKRLSDEIILLINGEIIDKGDSEKIFNNPSDFRTKNFISGKMLG